MYLTIFNIFTGILIYRSLQFMQSRPGQCSLNWSFHFTESQSFIHVILFVYHQYIMKLVNYTKAANQKWPFMQLALVHKSCYMTCDWTRSIGQCCQRVLNVCTTLLRSVMFFFSVLRIYQNEPR